MLVTINKKMRLNKKDESGTQRYIRYIISQKYSFLSIST